MTVHDSGANRMKARRAVSAQRGEKRKSNAELVDHLSAGRGDIGSIVFEILPSRHRSVLLQAIYLRHLFAYVKGGARDEVVQFLRGTKYCVPAPARSISRISSARSPGLATKSMSVVSTTSSGASS